MKKNKPIRLAVAALAILTADAIAAGCGGGMDCSDDRNKQSFVTISVEPGSVTISPGASSTILLTLTSYNFEGTVTPNISAFFPADGISLVPTSRHLARGRTEILPITLTASSAAQPRSEPYPKNIGLLEQASTAKIHVRVMSAADPTVYTYIFPNESSITQGESTRFSTTFTLSNYVTPISITPNITGLPDSVTFTSTPPIVDFDATGFGSCELRLTAALSTQPTGLSPAVLNVSATGADSANTAAFALTILALTGPGPDNLRVVFSSNHSAFGGPIAAQSDIFYLASLTSTPNNQTGTPASESSPRFNQDASRIVFTDEGGGIWLMNTDGSDRRRLNPQGLGGTPVYRAPGFAPDGRILFIHGSSSGRIAVMDAASGSAQFMTSSSVHANYATFTPDGSLIVFTGSVDGPVRNGVFSLDPATGSFNPIYLPSETPDRFFQGADSIHVSADGLRITYMLTFVDLTAYQDVISINISNLDGSQRRNLGGGRNPCFANDGRIVYEDTDPTNGNREIYIMNADGTGRTRVTHSTYAGSRSESPDAR